MNILIAPDSLKGSLTAQQAASHIQRALAHCIPNAEVEYFQYLMEEKERWKSGQN